MGFFDDVGKFVKNTAKDVKNVGKDVGGFVEDTAKNIGGVVNKNVNKIRRGIKEGESFIRKGVKRTLVKTEKGLKKAGFNKNFGRDFKKGFLMTAKALQKPQQWIEENDPSKQYLGGFSPIGLAASFGLSPITTIGFLEQMAVDKDLQQKVRDGDFETILNLSLSPLALMPLGTGTAVRKGGNVAVRSVAKNVGRFF
jgi:hypothetical protein